jgi:hypothetical protein
MSGQFTFNAFSYFSGVLTGLIIDWTDILPILGGFVLGLSVKRLPEFINIQDLPFFIQNYIQYFKLIGNGNNNEENNKKKL